MAVLSSVVLRLFSAAAAVLLGGCAATSLPLRTGMDGQSVPGYRGGRTGLDCLTHHGSNTVAFIEFDEQGDFKSRALAETVVRDIKETASTRGKRLLLTVYVHGWQNNPHPKSGDVEKFTMLINRLSAMPYVAQELGMHVYGVYMGWRGRLVPATTNRFIDTVFFSIPKVFSFWTREAAAERVGKLSSTEALMWMVKAARSNPDSRCLLIGHSFGALVLENAVAQTLIARSLDPSRQGRPISAPADLVVLVNQAAPSLTAKRLVEFANTAIEQRSGATISARRPLIVSVTSQADTATGTLFPIGRTLGSLFNFVGREYTDIKGLTRPVAQNEFTRKTSGHNELLLSHRVSDAGPATLPEGLSATEFNFKHPPGDKDAPWTFVGTSNRWTLSPTGGQFNRSPYWIISTPKEFIHDHGDVWNGNVMALVAALMGRNERMGAGSANITVASCPREDSQ